MQVPPPQCLIIIDINRHCTTYSSILSQYSSSCACIPSHHLVFYRYQSTAVVVSPLSNTFPICPSCPLHRTCVHRFTVLRSGQSLVFAGGALPSTPRTVTLIRPAFYDFWLRAPTEPSLSNVHSVSNRLYSYFSLCPAIVLASPRPPYLTFLASSRASTYSVAVAYFPDLHGPNQASLGPSNLVLPNLTFFHLLKLLPRIISSF
ncbi:hypothetical protein EI94DRAFT_622747 [Lactarius quietus]|nr:hypothetical protein EI94DRAFT_622747 [Lactarius quietus]